MIIPPKGAHEFTNAKRIFCAQVMTMIGGPAAANQAKSPTVLAIETARFRTIGLLVPFVLCILVFSALYGGARGVHAVSFIFITFNFWLPAPLSNTMITYVRYGSRKKLVAGKPESDGSEQCPFPTHAYLLLLAHECSPVHAHTHSNSLNPQPHAQTLTSTRIHSESFFRRHHTPSFLSLS